MKYAQTAEKHKGHTNTMCDKDTMTMDTMTMDMMTMQDEMLESPEVWRRNNAAQFLMTLGHPVALYNIFELLFYDLANSTDTSGTVAVNKFRTNHHNRRFAARYVPAFRTVVLRALAAIADADTEKRSFEFVDLGSGKGKVCLMLAKWLSRLSASDLPAIDKIRGLEICEDLIAIAEKNASRAGFVIDWEAIDVLDVDDYRDDSIFFAFNPFSTEVLQPLVERLSSLKNVYFIYNNPQHAQVFQSWRPIFRASSLINSLETRVWLSPGS